METQPLPPQGDALTPKVERLGRSRVWTIAIILINIELMLFAAWSYYEFGSVWAGISWLDGNQLVADTRTLSLGNLSRGDTRSAKVSVRNWSRHGIEIRRASRTGPCAVTERLPMTIEAGRKVSLTIAIQPQFTGPFQQSITLFTDNERQPFIEFVVQGTVVDTLGRDTGG